MIEFINKNKNHHDFAFRSYRYATIKTCLADKRATNEMCVNNEIFMFLIDRKFLTIKCFNISVLIMTLSNNVRKIEIKLHDTFSYVLLNFYVFELTKKFSIMTHFKNEMHLIKDLRINVFIEINIMRSKKMKLNFENNSLTIITCESFKASIQIKKRSGIINRSIRVLFKMIISFNVVMFVSIRIKSKSLSKNKNFNFLFKKQKMLNLENEFFAHIVDANLTAVQIRNALSKPCVMSKNLRVSQLIDYAEKKCYLIESKQKHLIIVSNKFDLKSNFNPETILQNETTVYENDSMMQKIAEMIDKYFELFKEISKTMRISFDQ